MKGERPMASGIVLISYYYAPYNTPASYRIAGMARSFEKAEYDVHCVTSNTFRARKDEKLARTLDSGASIVRTRTWELKRGIPGPGVTGKIKKVWNNIAERIEEYLLPLDSYVLWVIPAWLSARKLIRRHGIKTVLISSPPHSSQLIGLLLNWSDRVTVVSDFRDAWSQNPAIRSMNRASHWIMSRTENRILENSKLVVANTWSNKEMLERDFESAAGKTEVVLNGYFEQDGVIPPSKGEAGSIFRLVYAGELYAGYVDNIFETISNLKKQNPNLSASFQFEVAGLVDESDWSRIEGFGISDIIQYHGFLSYEDSLALIRSADAVLLVMPEHFRNVVGSKLYAYLGQRCRILALIPDGDAARIIRDVGAGVVITDNFVAEATAILSKWVLADRAPDFHYKEDRLSRYTREFQGEQLVKYVAKTL